MAAALTINFSTGFLGQKLYCCPRLDLQLYSRSSNRLSAKALDSLRSAGRILATCMQPTGEVEDQFSRGCLWTALRTERRRTLIWRPRPGAGRRSFDFDPRDSPLGLLLLIACINFLNKKMGNIVMAFVLGILAAELCVRYGWRLVQLMAVRFWWDPELVSILFLLVCGLFLLYTCLI